MKYNSMMKKAAALAIAVVMCVTMLPTAAFAADTADLTISTAEELIAFADAVNGGTSYSGKTVELGANIDLEGKEFTPIGNWTSSINYKTFKGSFDGKGYTISNAEIRGDDTTFHAGLFGGVSDGGSVQHLTLSNIHVTNTSKKSSGEVYNEASSGVAIGVIKNASVTDVHVDGLCSVEGVYRTGGIVGSSRDKNSSISNCTNAASVKGSSDYTGGIVGAAHDVWGSANDMGTTITDCTNSGTVSGTSEVGGIAGYADRAVVTGCTNEKSATVTGTGNYGTGGIVGCNIFNPLTLGSWVIMSPAVGSTIQSCTNSADVSGGYAGGILGAYVVAPGKKQPTSEVKCIINGCTSTGAINGVANRCGSIFGYQITYANGSADEYINHMIVAISDCTVGGSVNGGNAIATTSQFITN